MEYVGNDLKYAFSSTGAFDFNTMEWDMVFFVGTKKVNMKKRNVEGNAWQLTCDQKNMGFKPLSDGRWAFLIDTSYFGPGVLVAVLYAFIPDTDFDPTADFPTLDGARDEVRRFTLDTLVAL